MALLRSPIKAQLRIVTFLVTKKEPHRVAPTDFEKGEINDEEFLMLLVAVRVTIFRRLAATSSQVFETLARSFPMD